MWTCWTDAVKLIPIARGPGAGAMPSTRLLGQPGLAHACYFRSRAEPGRRKALLQITERCDLRCAHCFVSATRSGSDMTLDQLRGEAVGRLQAARVANVTITGGEPLVHPQLVEVLELFVEADFDVTVCTNGVSLTESHVRAMKELGRVKVNVSLDGFSIQSHGRFRGSRDSFHATVGNARQLADAGLLKGVLSTPNALVQPGEYRQLYAFARELGAEYLLMNPLSRFGRGVRAQSSLGADAETMAQIQSEILDEQGLGEDPEAVFIRFPHESRRPLTECIAGEIFYVFVNGDTTICPYLVFAARTPHSQHRPEEFIVGNLFRDADFSDRLDNDDFHERYVRGSNSTCGSCSHQSSCGNGCPAAVIGNGGRLGDLDADVCPVGDEQAATDVCDHRPPVASVRQR